MLVSSCTTNLSTEQLLFLEWGETSPGTRKNIMTEVHANTANPTPLTYTSSSWTLRPLSAHRRPCQELQLFKTRIPQAPKDRSLGCTHINELPSSKQKDRARATELMLPYTFVFVTLKKANVHTLNQRQQRMGSGSLLLQTITSHILLVAYPAGSSKYKPA